MLTFTSNDSDQANYEVILMGQGVEPPIISVIPDSLSANLFNGQTSTQIITIENTGGSNLTWKANITQSENSKRKSYPLNLPNPNFHPPDNEETQFNPNVLKFRTSPLQVKLTDLSDVHVMFDLAHGQYSSIDWSVIIADLTSRGAIVTENTSTITSTLLNNCDIFWTIEHSITFSASEINALQNWLLAGGSLLLEGDQYSSSFNALLNSLNSGIEFSDFYDPGNGITTNIFPHEITIDVDSLYCSPVGYLSSVNTPAELIANDLYGIYHLIASSKVGSGRLIAMADEIFGNYAMPISDNQLFANQVFDWLAFGNDWLAISPDSGTIAVGSSVDVDVTFQSMGLDGGDYNADIIINSNDPIDPEIIIPANMHVTGSPNIVFNIDTLDFSQVFLGVIDTLELIVENNGTLDLLISSVQALPAEYSVSPTFAGIDPGETEIFTITFLPQSVGDYPGTLNLTSNDPDSGNYEITLLGQGVEPPIILVSPDSLYAALFTGDTTTQTITISNNGNSDLIWNIDLDNIGLGTVTFTKQDYADWTDPGNQDRITDNVYITRANTNGIFNAVVETSYNYGSPFDTEWAYGYTANLDSNDYQIWRDAVYPPPSMVGQPLSMHLISDDRFFDVMFHNWTSGGYGGGFSYTRTDVEPRWLSASLDSGIVPAGSTINVDVTFDAAGLFGGDYAADIVINSNDPLNPTSYIPVSLNVTGVPDISVSISPYDSISTIHWYTYGASTIHNFATSFDAVGDGELTVAVDGNYYGSYEFADVYIEGNLIGTINPSVTGSTTQDFTITESDLNNYINDGIVTVTVTNSYYVYPGGNDFHSVRLAYSGASDSLDFGEVFVNYQTSKRILIENTGTDLLQISSITVDSAAFSVSPSSLNINFGEIDTVIVTLLPLSVGSYSGMLTIVTNDPDQGTIDIPLRGEALLLHR